FAFGSALRSRTARSAEFRPPIPLTETPPVSGPMNPTFTLSFAGALAPAPQRTRAAMPNDANFESLLIRSPFTGQSFQHSSRLWLTIVARRAYRGKGRVGGI